MGMQQWIESAVYILLIPATWLCLWLLFSAFVPGANQGANKTDTRHQAAEETSTAVHVSDVLARVGVKNDDRRPRRRRRRQAQKERRADSGVGKA
ncbi:hypothetical protein KRX51_03875 [Corynebacterium sp. TAE3-ERU12]|uniref:hypothetical protein n=1 Tax=Corynebacterium sp. TAE3-ERU12 TaxID=2849491 RepID=UPI001C47E8EB|nr:hypothetical protein [Corynebacterium sp. TAE3-ERU12]MBV7295056.1 hypothetical protein [Corynebacterium sp. TAE3-ERU12]